MLRFIASTTLELLANAVGMLIAATLLDSFEISGWAFLIAVGVFTLVKIIVAPLVISITVKYVEALRGGVSLVTTFLCLLITTWLTDGLVITGWDGWIVGTLIVWLAGVLAGLVLPLFLFKQILAPQKTAAQSAKDAAESADAAAQSAHTSTPTTPQSSSPSPPPSSPASPPPAPNTPAG